MKRENNGVEDRISREHRFEITPNHTYSRASFDFARAERRLSPAGRPTTPQSIRTAI